MRKLIAVTNTRALEMLLTYLKDRLELQEQCDPYKDNSPYIETCKEVLSQLY